jgi:hypothetical protein
MNTENTTLTLTLTAAQMARLNQIRAACVAGGSPHYDRKGDGMTYEQTVYHLIGVPPEAKGGAR